MDTLTMGLRNEFSPKWMELQAEARVSYAVSDLRCLVCGRALGRHDLRLQPSGPAKLAALRSMGADPAHGGGAGRKRGMSNALRAAERAEWEKQGLDLEEEKE